MKLTKEDILVFPDWCEINGSGIKEEPYVYEKIKTIELSKLREVVKELKNNPVPEIHLKYSKIDKSLSKDYISLDLLKERIDDLFGVVLE